MAGLLIWLGYTRNPDLKVPYFVAYVCAFTLTMSALALGAKISGRSAANHAFAALTLLGFAAAGAWIAFAPGGPQQSRLASGAVTSTPPDAWWTHRQRRAASSSGQVL